MENTGKNTNKAPAKKAVAVLLLATAVLFTLFLSRNVTDSPHPEGDPTVVAMVADKAISVSDLTTNMTRRGGGKPQRFTDLEQKHALLKEMIQREAQLIAAKKAGYEQAPEIVAALENMMIARLRSEQLEKTLATISVNDDEINAYYRSNLHKYTTPEMSRLAIVYLALSDKASEEKKREVMARADELYTLAQTLPESIKGFGALAAKYSEHQASRYVGGDVGWLAREHPNTGMDEAVQQAVTKLQTPGDMAPLVKGEDGFYLVKLLDQKPVETRSLVEVRRNVEHLLLKQKRQQAENEWLQRLEYQAAPISINEAVLTSVQPPQPERSHTQSDTPPALPKQ